VTPAAADVTHLLVAAALTYALGFERDLRGPRQVTACSPSAASARGSSAYSRCTGAPTALQGALVGIGFIGAGPVFRSRRVTCH
jgi:putative Mg2+ transporter-C (MgtC) family protein